MHHIMKCIQKLQALNQQLENIKQRVVKNTGLDFPSQDASIALAPWAAHERSRRNAETYMNWVQIKDSPLREVLTVI